MESNLVWYVSYGSNLSAARFDCYIMGGRPAGALRDYRGCSDTTAPRKDRSVMLRQSLYFAGESLTWTGGVGFITLKPSDEPTPGRAYLITLDQFKQVHMQENRRDQIWDFELDDLLDKGSIRTPDDNRYGLLLHCGALEGRPLLTFTNPYPEEQEITRPAPAYLKTMANGLREAHGFDNEAVVNYLIQRPGAIGNYDRAELLAVVSSI